jgi:hypothetical protein
MDIKIFSRFFIVCFFLCTFSTGVHAQKIAHGEIINVNHTKAIAFTDLTNSKLSMGDIVEIYNNDHFVTYLQVIETQEALSRLAFVTRDGLNTKESVFKDITIGSVVIKVDQGGAQMNLDGILSKLNRYKSAQGSLQQQLHNEKVKINTYEQKQIQNQQNTDQLNQTITTLKDQLLRMTTILDEKIKIYESRK